MALNRVHIGESRVCQKYCNLRHAVHVYNGTVNVLKIRTPKFLKK